MAKYVFKRVILAIVTIFIVCAITFFTMNAIPGGPFNGEKATSPQVRETLEKRFNLDKPVGEQFVIYMKNLLHGDFGISAKTGRDIGVTISSKFAVSAKLGIFAVIVALILGVFFGSIAALMRNRWPDRLIIFMSTLFTSLPSFVLATGGLYYPSDQDEHAGRPGAGLRKDCPGKGRRPGKGAFCPYAAQFPDPGCNLCGADDRFCPDRIACC